MSNKKYPDANSLSRFWNNVKNFVTQGALRIFPTSSEGASIDVYGDSTYNATIGVANSNIAGTMHLNMDTLGAKELVVYDSNGNRSTVVGQDASGNYFGDVFDALDGKADLASPTLTGTPTAPTPTTGDNSTKIATTAFVQAAIDALSYHKGNIVDLRNSVFAGVFTGGQKSIVFYIPLNKPIASDISSVALISTSVEVRHSDGGYIIASNSGGLSDYGSLACAINYSRTGVLVTLTLTTADTRYANNAPIAVRGYGTFTITFR